MAEQKDKAKRTRDGGEGEDSREAKVQAAEDTEEQRASENESAEDGETEASGDEAASRVAKALGVESDPAEGEEAAGGEESEAEQEEKAAPPNRAARRREEALDRRRKKRGASASEDKTDAPKDRNARAKQLLAKRREQAAEQRPVASALDAGEMVDDVLARTASAASKWIRQNLHIIQWVVVAGLLGTVGVLVYTWRTEKNAGAASTALASAMLAERSKVMAEDKRSEEEKEFDVGRIFKTPEERAEAALSAYNQVIDKHAGTGPALLARLGQAGVFLEKKEFDKALEAYSAVLASALAAADPDVKGRATEGIGFAKEGKGDLDGALASFKDLEGVDSKGYKELALYHQARIQLAKGDKEKAKELIKSAREKLEKAKLEGGQQAFQFLEAVVDEMLREVDPSAAPARPQIGGPRGDSISPEELEKLLKRAREAAEKKAAGEQGGQH